MKKNENIIEKIEYEDMKIGRPYIITLTSGATIIGVLFNKCENLVGGETEKQYGVSFDKTTYVYLNDNQIEKVKELKSVNMKEYFKEFENRYDITCFDDDGECLPGSEILRNITCTDAWEMLSDTEKQELMQYLSFNKDEILDIIEAYMLLKKENKKLHNDKVRVLDEALEIMENYKKYTSAATYAKNIHDLLFKELGMEKFINSVCLR